MSLVLRKLLTEQIALISCDSSIWFTRFVTSYDEVYLQFAMMCTWNPSPRVSSVVPFCSKLYVASMIDLLLIILVTSFWNGMKLLPGAGRMVMKNQCSPGFRVDEVSLASSRISTARVMICVVRLRHIAMRDCLIFSLSSSV